jgi:hypothetical protein
MDHGIMSSKPSRWLRLSTETTWREGPWHFISDGVIGAYPRFVNDAGSTVFLHAVAETRQDDPGSAQMTGDSTRACPICLRDLPDSDDAVNDHYDREHPSIDTDTAMPADAANLICRMVRDECFRTFEANGKAMPLADYVADVVQHLPDHDTSQEVQQP